MAKLLLVDDDVQLLESLGRGLEFSGFRVKSVPSAGEALGLLESWSPQVVVLDVAMPGMDGLTFCTLIRRQSDVPVLMLTARDEVPDRVRGLEAGADDYLVKPFALDELVARLRALLRRTSGQTTVSETYAAEDITLDRRCWKATFRDRSLDLTTTEFQMLQKLVSDPERVVPRDELAMAAWGDEGGVESNSLDVHVSNLRKKLDAAGGGHLIRTVRRVGYSLKKTD